MSWVNGVKRFKNKFILSVMGVVGLTASAVLLLPPFNPKISYSTEWGLCVENATLEDIVDKKSTETAFLYLDISPNKIKENGQDICLQSQIELGNNYPFSGYVSIFRHEEKTGSHYKFGESGVIFAKGLKFMQEDGLDILYQKFKVFDKQPRRETKYCFLDELPENMENRDPWLIDFFRDVQKCTPDIFINNAEFENHVYEMAGKMGYSRKKISGLNYTDVAKLSIDLVCDIFDDSEADNKSSSPPPIEDYLAKIRRGETPKDHCLGYSYRVAGIYELFKKNNQKLEHTFVFPIAVDWYGFKHYSHSLNILYVASDETHGAFFDSHGYDLMKKDKSWLYPRKLSVSITRFRH